MDDDSWKSLYLGGGVSMILAGISLLVVIASLVLLQPFVAEFAAAHPLPTAAGPSDFLTFVWSHSWYYYLWFASQGLALVLLVPAVVALFVVLMKTDRGWALIGTSLFLTGIGIVLSGLPNHFFLIEEAQTFQGGCSVCASQALAGSAAAFSADTADTIGILVIDVAVVILSLVIWKGSVFAKGVAYLGLVVGIYGILLGFAPDLGDLSFDLGTGLPLLLFAGWLLAVGAKLYKLR